MWTMPGLNDAVSVPLQMAMSVLGGLSSSRLDNALVRKNPVAVSVSAGASPFEDAGIVLVQADVKPGVDPAHVAKRLDEEIAAFLESGPTAAELTPATATHVGIAITHPKQGGGIGGQAVSQGEGAPYASKPNNTTV